MRQNRFGELIDKAGVSTRASILRTCSPMLRDRCIIADWFTAIRNWGDLTSPVIIEHLSGKKPVMSRHVPNVRSSPVYMVVGSLLQTCRDRNTVVWGTGLISADTIMPVRPRKICAVRGPLTRERLRKQGMDCPPVYGDPALLFPGIYRPEVPKRFKLGIVPHYFDAPLSSLERFRGSEEVKVLDVGSGVRDYVDDLCSCQVIASSSLHGCIAADAYRIPSLWIELSSKVEGEGFKFRDYYESIGEHNVRPYPVSGDIDVDELISACHRKQIGADIDELMTVCPFLPGT